MKPGIGIKAIGALFIISLAVFFFSNNHIDPDIWGHLKFGQDIYQTHQIARYDTYSYSAYGAGWINHEWLSELILFTIFKFFKSAGLIIFKVALGIIIISMIFMTASRRTKSIFLKLSVLAVALSVISVGFRTRPQIFTYLFFTAFVFLIDKYEHTSDHRWLYPLPLISLAWCNLHGGFIAGIGLLCLYSLFRLFKKNLSRNLMVITALSIVATLINPYGKNLWIFLLNTLSSPRPYIHEWRKVSLSFFYFDYFVMLSLALIGVVFSKVKRPSFEMTALSLGAVFSFLQSRHTVLFAILAAMYIPRYIDSFAGSWLEGIERRFLKKAFAALLIIVSIYLCLMAPYRGLSEPFRIKIPEERYPVDAIEFIKANNISGNIFAFFNWSQICIRELSDTCKVFFDGRYRTVYSDELINGYFEALYCKRDYYDFLKGFPETDIMLLHRHNPLALLLTNNQDWVLVHSISPAKVFLKKNRRNNDIIERYETGALIRPNKRAPFYLD